MGIHFETININPIGRNTSGVKSIKLKENDEVLIGLPYDTAKERTLAIFNTKEKGMLIELMGKPLKYCPECGEKLE